MRRLGPFELLALVGKSRRTMAWKTRDLRGGSTLRDSLLLLPRQQPSDEAAAQRLGQALRRAARLAHPNLAAPVELGSCEGWPYALYDAGGSQTLADRLRGPALTAQEAAMLCMQAARAIAFAHEGGVAHGDLQPYMWLLSEHRQLRIVGLEVALPRPEAERAIDTGIDRLQLTAQREAAQRDVLSMGLLLHWMLAGRPALEEADIGAQLDRMAPLGRDIVRLPWSTTLPVPEALRAVANRATERQVRQRYLSARGIERALDGWLRSETSTGGGPIALLLDRMQAAGALPSAPGAQGRAARLAGMGNERTSELAAVVLQDLALSFELLRAVNRSLRRTALSSDAQVLTVRRAIAMLGMDGVRRAAVGLRPWPGPLDDAAALALGAVIESTQRAARLAQLLRPAGFDAEVVRLVTLLQNLGRLLSAYHFPDEWQQVLRLMQPDPAAQTDSSAGTASATSATGSEMSEQAASYAVLGVDIERIGVAVARHWGLDDAVSHMVRRMPLTTMLRTLDSDEDTVRAVASCAHEAVDALNLPAGALDAALRRVAQRYGRLLRFKLEDLETALRKSGRPDASATARHDDAAQAVRGAMATPYRTASSQGDEPYPGTGPNG